MIMLMHLFSILVARGPLFLPIHLTGSDFQFHFLLFQDENFKAKGMFSIRQFWLLFVTFILILILIY